MSRKLLKLLFLPLILCLSLASPAMAAQGNAHFIKNATNATLSGSDLVVHFKETGLASGATETITATASALTTYECVNNGGHNPSASNKTTTQTKVSASGQFTADKNGNVEDTLTLSPPSASDLGFSCPSGQTVTFVPVTYSSVMVTDETSDATFSIPGSYPYTNPLAP